MDSWPAFRESAIRQWAGLSDEERAFYEQIIATRERYGMGGCLQGGPMVLTQINTPLWLVEHRRGHEVALISVKGDIRDE